MSFEDRPPRKDASAFDRLAGAALIAFGVLLATLCGLCSLAVGGSMMVGTFTQMSHGGGQVGLFWESAIQMLLLIGVFGGAPFGIGVALIFAGLRLRRGGPPPPPR